MSEGTCGNFFEDFRLGKTFRHATPRTVRHSDSTLYTSLYGTRFAVQQSEPFARAIGYPAAPIDDLLVFHLVFGKSVADISLNATANLGYAECRFLAPVYAGDTLTASSEVIGLTENSNGKTGIVYVRTAGYNQRTERVLEYARWVMVPKRDAKARLVEAAAPRMADAVDVSGLGAACPAIDRGRWDDGLAGSWRHFDDYAAGETIDHVDGVTIEDAEHMMAARLYHNTARVHFNAQEQRTGRFGRRIVYGGHVMSIARALSFNGLANTFHVAAINAGRHVAPVFAGNTVYAWTTVAGKARLIGREDVGALRLVTRATRNLSAAKFPTAPADKDQPGVVLELDYWVLVPR
ncbi:MAG: MaoC family dehydratase [Pseudomonadota bacterium]|nr:MaoC family dehydratase [Pseudomonadota bacterium]